MYMYSVALSSFHHKLCNLSYSYILLNFLTIQRLWPVLANPAKMEQHVLITMVVVDMSVSVLLALREPTVKMVHISATFIEFINVGKLT